VIAGPGIPVGLFHMSRIAVPVGVGGVPVLLMQGLGFLPVVPFAGNRDEEQSGGEEVERFHPRRMYPLLAC
jgi:hypothetical protein